jgi:hypothetical protein
MKAARMAGVLLASGAIVAVGVAAAPAQVRVDTEADAEDPCASTLLPLRVMADSDDDAADAAEDAADDAEDAAEDAADDAADDAEEAAEEAAEDAEDEADDDAPAAGVTPISADVPCGDPFDGPPVSNLRGTYQARIFVFEGEVVDVQAVVAGTSAPESVAVNTMAIPQFRERVLAAQSWDVDAVSGASYTSPAFLESLEGAFAAAGLN